MLCFTQFNSSSQFVLVHVAMHACSNAPSFACSIDFPSSPICSWVTVQFSSNLNFNGFGLGLQWRHFLHGDGKHSILTRRRIESHCSYHYTYWWLRQRTVPIRDVDLTTEKETTTIETCNSSKYVFCMCECISLQLYIQDSIGTDKFTHKQRDGIKEEQTQRRLRLGL